MQNNFSSIKKEKIDKRGFRRLNSGSFGIPNFGTEGHRIESKRFLPLITKF